MTSRAWIRKLFARTPRTARKTPPRYRPRLEGLESRVVLSTFTVTNTLDDGSAGSLRWAVAAANSNSGPDTIDFDPAVFNAGPGRTTIRLTAGQLSLTDTATTTIAGPAAYRLTISGNNASRVFLVDGGSSAAFSGLTIAEGRAPQGGGLYIGTGTVTMTQVAVDRNVATGGGSTGGYGFALGTAGAGIRNAAGTLTMDGCTVSRNQCLGGDFDGGTGGGLANSGTATLTNCTFGYNYADISAALYTEGGLLTLNQCSFGTNVVRYPEGGSIGPGGPMDGHNNIVVETIIDSAFRQLAGKDFDEPGMVIPIPPGFPYSGNPFFRGLAPLGYYGGPTETMPPTFEALTVDVGDEYPGMPAFDQRGFPRIGRIDVGAVEYRPLVVNHVGDEAYTPTGVFRGDPALDLLPGPTPWGQLSLRQAVALATPFLWRVQGDGLPEDVSRNPWSRVAREAQTEIRFDPEVFATARTISLSGPLNFDRYVGFAWLPLDLSWSQVALIGPGADLLTIDSGTHPGEYAYQLSWFQPTSASLSGITVSGTVGVTEDGHVTLENVVIRDSEGIGLYVGANAQATLIGCTITGHRNTGVFTNGQLIVIDSTVSDNANGGIRVFDSFSGTGAIFARATLVRCTIRGNTSAVRGAGIDVLIERGSLDARSGLILIDSTVAENATAGNGGGLYLGSGMAVLTGSTFSGNTAQRGGAIYVNDRSFSFFDQVLRTSDLTVDHCTIADNIAAMGGNLYSDPAPVSVTLTGTIVSGGGGNGGDIVALGPLAGSGNLVEDGSGGLPDSRTGDPRLAPLGNYGGPTLTRALLPGSPALDAGPAVTPAPLATPTGVAAAGAGEAGGSLVPGNTYSYRVTAFNHLGETLASQAVTVTLSLGPSPSFRPYTVAQVTWTAVPGALGYKIYGRTAGSEELLATVPFGLMGDVYDGFIQRYLDYGSAGPGGAPPAANTSGGPVDQRGLPRNVGAGSDLGAFESGGFTLTPVAGSTPQSTLVGTAFANPLAVSVTANNPVEPVNGGGVRFTAPESGASAVLSTGTATIANGQASVAATANAIGGSYSVTATVAGATSADFHLTNTVANQSPTLAVPPAQTAYEDVDKAITGIIVGDPDGGSLTVTLAVGHGKLTLGTTSGLTVSGNGTGVVTLSGSIAHLNAALASLVYRGSLNYSGADTLSLTASDGSLSTNRSVGLTVQSSAQQASALQAQVTALRTAGVLNHGQATALNAHLNLHDNPGDIGRVQSFLNQVNAFLNAGILTPAQANALLGPGNILLLSVTRR
jgi:hypothetical protein